mmetsp:Transcript_22116/g.37512  ORF Transcript_22116/g.37512 Transcript_22116/m.37512 type:complete len:366 (-) Transcript_22116:117-1214(-)
MTVGVDRRCPGPGVGGLPLHVAASGRRSLLPDRRRAIRALGSGHKLNGRPLRLWPHFHVRAGLEGSVSKFVVVDQRRDLFVQPLPFFRNQSVNPKDSIQMVIFMLEDSCGPPLESVLLRLPLQVDRPHNNGIGAVHGPLEWVRLLKGQQRLCWEAQTALGGVDDALAEGDDDRIDQHLLQLLVVTFPRGVVHHHPFVDPNLRGCKPNAVRLVHHLKHLARNLLHFSGENLLFCDQLVLCPQNRVGVLNDFQAVHQSWINLIFLKLSSCPEIIKNGGGELFNRQVPLFRPYFWLPGRQKGLWRPPSSLAFLAFLLCGTTEALRFASSVQWTRHGRRSRHLQPGHCHGLGRPQLPGPRRLPGPESNA